MNSSVKSEQRRGQEASPNQPISNDIFRAIAKPDIYSSSLEANITGSGSGLSTPRGNSKRASPVQIKEARIINSASSRSSPAQKSFVLPKTPIAPSNPFVGEDYDEAKNPFADEKDDEDEKNPFKDDTDDDYDRNLNPFAS